MPVSCALSYRSLLFAVTISLALTGNAMPADHIHHAWRHLADTEEIPRDYKTWSLFLICSPGWILKKGNAGISDLYKEFQAFGDAIGSENIAIWFWKREGERTAENTNISRSGQYCKKYNLLPSNSPQILVTTHYSDDQGLGHYYLIKLNGLDPSDSASAVDKLTDQLMQTGLDQASIDENQFWHRLLTATTTALEAAGCYFNKVSISLRTGVLNIDIGHSVQGKC